MTDLTPAASTQPSGSAIGDVARPICPADAAAWFRDNFEVFDRPELGGVYLKLLGAWQALEAKNEFDIGKGTRLRDPRKPPVLKAWIQAGRAPRTKKIPDIADVDAFAKQVWIWWASLQPEGREVDAEGLAQPSRDVVDDWGAALGVRGQNGMLSVVACLCWWGLANNEAQRASDGLWCRLVEDATWVCEQMAG
ncbi:hypothetical protein EV121DRAFT_218423 [Schizophyllum commune]